jgi:hypothetical protein
LLWTGPTDCQGSLEPLLGWGWSRSQEVRVGGGKDGWRSYIKTLDSPWRPGGVVLEFLGPGQGPPYLPTLSCMATFVLAEDAGRPLLLGDHKMREMCCIPSRVGPSLVPSFRHPGDSCSSCTCPFCPCPQKNCHTNQMKHRRVPSISSSPPGLSNSVSPRTKTPNFFLCVIGI